MLSVQEVQQHLTRLSYKPGWEFECYEGRWEGMHIVIRTPVEDAFNPGQTVVLDVHCFFPRPESTEELERWLMWRLARIEVHEMREFFKRDGKVIDSPHKKDADRDL